MTAFNKVTMLLKADDGSRTWGKFKEFVVAQAIKELSEAK